MTRWESVDPRDGSPWRQGLIRLIALDDALVVRGFQRRLQVVESVPFAPSGLRLFRPVVAIVESAFLCIATADERQMLQSVPSIGGAGRGPGTIALSPDGEYYDRSTLRAASC